jgi:hypothetical protein
MPVRSRRIEQRRRPKGPEGLIDGGRADLEVPGQVPCAPAAIRRVDKALEDLPLAIAAEQPIAQLLLAAPASSVVRRCRLP